MTNPPFQRLLVTGALGTVASIVVPTLGQLGALRLTDITAGETGGVPVAACNLLDFSALLSAMRGCDAVLHLAIASGRHFPDRTVPPEGIAPFDAATLDVNTRGAHHLFEAAARLGVRRVVQMSSLTVIQGYPTAQERATAGLLPRPTKLYALTKWFGEELGALYHRQHGLEVISLRLGQPYPLGTHHDEAVLGTPEGRQFAIHQDDLCAGVRAALTTPLSFGVFNLASEGDPCSVDLASGALIGYTPAYRFHPGGPRRKNA